MKQSEEPKGLVLGFDPPCGHWTAALALSRTAGMLGVRVDLHDALGYTSELSNHVIRAVYRRVLLRMPIVWDSAYRRPAKKGVAGPATSMAAWDTLFRPSFERLARRLPKYRYVICTQAYAAHMVLRAIDLMPPVMPRPRVFGVATDLVPHAAWDLPGLHKLFVTNKDWQLVPMRVPRDEAGIPIHPRFAQICANRESAVRAHPLGDKLRVLVCGGSLGLGPMLELVENIVQQNLPVELDVLCGSNRVLGHAIGGLGTNETPVRALHVDPDGEQAAFFQRADIYLGKAGGISVAEAMACGLPLILAFLLPGQERLNMERLNALGCSRFAENIEQACSLLSDWIQRPEARLAAGEISRKWGRPDASIVIWKKILAEEGQDAFYAKDATNGSVAPASIIRNG
jgi:processive 1,2-diacylglycerol beta-glucosyltransferase